MPRFVTIVTLLVLGGATVLHAQEDAMPDTVRYRISWENPASQLYTVETTAATDGAPLVFSLPAWRPGRYIVQNYASNVQAVRATQGGREVPVEWVDLDSWRVEPAGPGDVTLAYEYYARTFDAGSSTLTPEAAYVNPVNLLPWVEGRKDAPARLEIAAPADWEVATQLEPLPGEGHAFSAPDYDRLVDSPTIASGDLVHWRTEVDGVPFHVVFRSVGGPLDLGPRTRAGILADIAAIAREQAAIFGGTFPFEEYWHLYQIVPYPFGHAVEHEASASYVLQDAALTTDAGYRGFLGVTSHEQFHAWNVKRMRPAALWPYDYAEPQLTRLHWLTEGVTSYYDDLTLVRADLITPETYFEALGNNVNALQSAPGRHVTSASLASLTSWHSGYGGGNPNQSVSFYTKGALLGLLLDLAIRDATDGERSFDDVLRRLWGTSYERGQGIPEDGVQSAVEAVAGRDFDDFFESYVHGTEELPYDRWLGVVGLTAERVARDDRPAATTGLSLAAEGDSIVVGNVLPDGPALAAGIMIGDAIVAVDGEPLAAPTLDPVLAARAPGDTLTVRIRRHGRESDRSIVLAGEGNLVWRVGPVADPTERQLAMREAWLASNLEGGTTD